MSSITNGQAQSGFGKLESVAGDAIGNHDVQADGAKNQAEGKVKEVAGSAQKAVGQAADQARDALEGVAGKAKETYGAAVDKAQALKGRVDPVVQEKPYLALLGAFALGFVASRILAPGGPKVVYAKPRA